MTRHTLRAGTIHVGDWLQADLTPGYTLAIVDGPYGMSKAAWDRMGIDGLADWYAPHIARMSALLAPSASVYLWNTAEGWARIDPVMRAAGWTFRGLVTWDKGLGAMAGKIDTEAMRTWFDVTEVAGFYQRESPSPFPELLTRRRELAGCSRREIAALFPSRTGGLTGCVLNWEVGYNVPTRDQWITMMSFLSERSHATVPQLASAEYDHLRAEYEASRPAFNLPTGITNVWSAPIVAGGERLTGPTGAALHPCQKPLLFAERMIRASTRPGERVLVPFGGTCREAVVCEWMARTNPAEARGYDVCELNADGVDYIGPVLAQIRGEDVRPKAAGQVRLFG